jgi:DNA mismatch repair protein MutL
MSDVIRLLPDHIANQIAAGEVIQRPASVVKELIENAIDSGASHIDLVIKEAGKTLIQVIDNGCGISELDARMAFERHATSKVTSVDDLFSLKTKGFRGEALASIAAIAQVELTTRQSDSDLGTFLSIEGSKIKTQESITCKTGSSFFVKNLFFNVPARRNFLKSDTVEFKHIEEEFIRVVLAHPEIGFTFHSNDTLIYKLNEANLRKRIVDIFGRNINEKLIPINEVTDLITITGFIGKPEIAKKSRGEQYLFVNNRYFKDSYFNHAISSAFDNLLTPKTFPTYFLFFQVNPATIDVNVHPTKTEIKFENDKEIYSILKSSIKLGLGMYNIAPSLDFETEKSFEIPYDTYSKPIVEPTITVNPHYNPFKCSQNYKSSPSGMSDAIRNVGFNNTTQTKDNWNDFYAVVDVNSDKDFQQKIEIEENTTYKSYIIKGSYIVTTTHSGILVVHAPRAQERIVYDEIMKTFIYKPLNSQQLLFPVTYNSKRSTILQWEENKTTLNRMGFSWDVIDESIQIIGIPAELNEAKILKVVEHITVSIENNTFDKSELAHLIASGISKQSRWKTKESSSESAKLLVEKLFLCAENTYTPDGKIIYKELDLDEIITNF